MEVFISRDETKLWDDETRDKNFDCHTASLGNYIHRRSLDMNLNNSVTLDA